MGCMLNASYRIDWPDNPERRHELDSALVKAVGRVPTGTGTLVATRTRDVDWMFKDCKTAERAAERVRRIEAVFRGRAFRVSVYPTEG